MWRSRKSLADLPQHMREHALHQQSLDPRLTDMIAWSPAEAKMACESDPCIKKLRFEDAIHLLPTGWAKPVKVRDRHQIHLTDELLPGEELIYLPELTTPRGRVEYLQPGDELLVYLNPLMPDQVLVCDRQHTYLGTITRSVRIAHDNNQLEEMFRQRARLKGHMDGPVRRAMQPVADRRAAVKQVNAEILAVGKATDSDDEPLKSAKPAPHNKRGAGGSPADPFASPSTTTTTAAPAPVNDIDPFV